MKLMGEEKVPDMTHKLGDKQIADVVEAILGAALLSGGFNVALQAAVALGIETYGIHTWNDLKRLYTPPKFLAKLNRLVEGQALVEDIYDYTFHNNGYLEQAFTHGSLPINRDDPVPSYQRLGT